MLTHSDLPKIYEKLSADLPSVGIQQVSKEVSRKGYDSTGYGYQFHVNRMNEVLFGHWRAIHTVIKEEEGITARGKTIYRKIVHMTLQIGNWVTLESGENRFQVLMEVEGYGGHESLEEASAYKGAYTNAFKKTTAMLGVGKRAFEGLLDEDLLAIEAQEEPIEKDAQIDLVTEKKKEILAACREKSLTDQQAAELVQYFLGENEMTIKEANDILETVRTMDTNDLLEIVMIAANEANEQKQALGATPGQIRKIHASSRAKGLSEVEKRDIIKKFSGGRTESTKNLTRIEASKVIEGIEKKAQAKKALLRDLKNKAQAQ